MTEPRCTRIWQIEARHDGRLQGAEADAVVAHAGRCDECCEEKRRFDSLLAKLRMLREPRLDDVSHARGKQRLLAAADAATLARAPSRPFVGVVLCVTVAVAAGAVAFVRGTWPAPQPRAAVVFTRSLDGARFSRRTDRGHEVVALVEGELAVRVRHIRGSRGPAVTVHVPDGIVRDEGTTFRVRVHEGRTVSIVVTEGRVAFVPNDGPVIRVHAGERWERPNTRSSTPLAPPSEPARAPPGVQRVPTREPPRQALAPRVAPTAPDVAPSPEDASEVAEALEDRLYLDALAAFRGGDPGRARHLAASYVARFPNGFRRVEMQGIVASIPPE